MKTKKNNSLINQNTVKTLFIVFILFTLIFLLNVNKIVKGGYLEDNTDILGEGLPEKEADENNQELDGENKVPSWKWGIEDDTSPEIAEGSGPNDLEVDGSLGAGVGAEGDIKTSIPSCKYKKCVGSFCKSVQYDCADGKKSDGCIRNSQCKDDDDRKKCYCDVCVGGCNPGCRQKAFYGDDCPCVPDCSECGGPSPEDEETCSYENYVACRKLMYIQKLVGILDIMEKT